MGGSKSTSKQKSTTTSEIPAEVRERGTQITTSAMNAYHDPAQKYSPFNYDSYKGIGEATTGQLNPNHDAAGAQYTDATTNYKPYLTQSTGVAQNASANTATGVNGPDFTTANVQKFQNPYQSLVIDQGLTDIGTALNTQRLDNQSRAANAGAFGGSRHGVIDAESQRTAADTAQRFIGDRLFEGYNSAVGQYNTDFAQGLQANAQNNAAAGQNYNQGMGYADYLAKLGVQTQAQAITGGDAMMKYGDKITAQEEAQKQNAYNYGYLDQRNYPLEVYERLAALNAAQPVNRTSTSTGNTTEKSGGGWLGPALQAGGTLLSMSDETAKENIHDRDPEAVLGAFAQVSPVTYTYKDDARRAHPELTHEGERRGFMAQDYERAFKRPSGPTTRDGYKTVDIPNVLGDLVAAVKGLEARTRTLKKKPN